MQCGIPVAASNVSSIPEICGQGNALFFDPKDPGDMAKKINSILVDNKLKKRLIENGLAHVRSFSWELMAKQTLLVVTT